jgi:hypothetical protein
MLAMLEESLARDIPLIAELLAKGDVPGANRAGRRGGTQQDRTQ